MGNLVSTLFNQNCPITDEYRLLDPSVWHLHGCLVSAATAIGLHRESSKEEYETKFIRAQRRRMEYAAIYTLDKVLSTFTGRPPLLLRRFSNALPPLDLTDEEVLLADSEREAATAQLNSEGWNRFGRVCPASFSRAQLLVAYAREDVLELMLTFPESVDMGSISYVFQHLQ
jgi:hypothetical protein